LHITHKCAAKAEKAIFRSENPGAALGRGKQVKRWNVCMAAINTPNRIAGIGRRSIKTQAQCRAIVIYCAQTREKTGSRSKTLYLSLTRSVRQKNHQPVALACAEVKKEQQKQMRAEQENPYCWMGTACRAHRARRMCNLMPDKRLDEGGGR